MEYNIYNSWQYKNYINNKLMYDKIKEITLIGGKKNKTFYILHQTNFNNMKQIFKSKALKANKDLNKKYWRLSGDLLSKYVFASIIINKKSNESGLFGLMFDDKILYNESFYFHKYWSSEPSDESIYVGKVLSKKDKSKKINQILDIVDSFIIKGDITVPKFMTSEVLFDNEIDLKYLIGIYCSDCNKKQVDMIKKLLKKYNRHDVIIYTTHNLPVI